MPLDDYTEIQVPEVGFYLQEDQLQQLHQVLHSDPLSDDNNYGINHYCELLTYITSNPAVAVVHITYNIICSGVSRGGAQGARALP